MRRTLMPLVTIMAAAWGVACSRSSEGSWRLTASMAIDRHYQRFTVLPSGKVLTSGTNSHDAPHSTGATELYDEATGAWSNAAPLADFHDCGAAVRLSSGRVLVAGGHNLDVEGMPVTAAAEVFDETTGSWTSTGSLNEARTWPGGALLDSGKVLVVGGGAGLFPQDVILSSAELYDPVAGNFSVTAAMAQKRQFQPTVLLKSGKVMVVGGCTESFNNCAPTGSAEVYDPVTGAWSSAGEIGPTFQLAATVLDNGQVLATGGCPAGSTPAYCSPIKDAYLYDPGTNAWTRTGSLRCGRAGHVAKLLRSGKVLVVGGNEGVGCSHRTEIFDPATGTWVDGPDTLRKHGSGAQTATLPSGAWLVAGGAGTGWGTASAEIYEEE